jgi:hypothetical protein
MVDDGGVERRWDEGHQNTEPCERLATAPPAAMLRWGTGAETMRCTRATTALLAAVLVAGCPGRRAQQDPVAPPPTPPPGYPARGATIAQELLDHHLPPPPKDAVLYEVRHPLNNGPTVPVKKRWFWIPDGTKIRLSTVDGKVAVKVPVGAMLWKEFYLRAGERTGLVERRILRKVADRDQENGWLLNGGWRFYTSHHLPRRADGKNGYENELTVPIGEKAPYFFPPERWMPTQAKGAATFLTFTGGRGERYPYVFPGKTQCTVCHDGAAGGYGNPGARPVLAFGPHPDNLTAASFQALVKRGWIDAPVALAERYGEPSPPPADDRTGLLVAVFRNNCLSCHNGSARSIGRETGFVLEPGKDYTVEALRARLQRRSTVMGRLGLPVVAPGSPGQSELVLRLKGAAGRRRMPPAEGGLPDRDEALIKLASRWVAELGRR